MKASSEAIESVGGSIARTSQHVFEGSNLSKNQLKILMERVDDSVELTGALKSDFAINAMAIQTVTVEETKYAQKVMQSETLRAQSDAKQRT